MKLAREFGLMYDSSLMADDRPYEVLIDGAATGAAELPVEWIMDDLPYFGMDRQTSLRPYTTPYKVFTVWRTEFDKAYEEGTMFILTMHPHLIGHRSRVANAGAFGAIYAFTPRGLVRDSRRDRAIRQLEEGVIEVNSDGIL